MIPFRLFFQPTSLFHLYPRRDWRRITLWLKWGLLFSFFGIFLKILLADDPASVSALMRFLKYLAGESEVAIPRFINLSLFIIIKMTYLIALWLIRGLLIFIGMKFAANAFIEFPVALSISGASLVSGFWYWLPFPYGYLLYAAHGIFLIAILKVNINREKYLPAIITGIIAGMLPLLI